MENLEFPGEQRTTLGGMKFVTKVYSANTRAEVIAHLEKMSLDRMRFSIEMRTPQGHCGKEFEGKFNPSGSFSDKGDPTFFTESAE